MIPATAPHSVPIHADDGIRLATDHYRSSIREEPMGTVLIRTPYGRSQYAGQAGAWMRAGYDVVVQDVRGRYGSEGEWRPYVSEGRDGAETAEKLAALDLLRGPLILAGASYDAHCAVEAARVLELELERIPASTAGQASKVIPFAIVAMVPALGLHETARHPDGTPRLRDRIGWWHQHGFGSTSKEPLHPAELHYRTTQAKIRGRNLALQGLFQDDEYGPGASDTWRQLWDAPSLDLHALYSKLSTPLLMISGRDDFFVAEALALAQVWGSAVPGTVVQTLWGPWGHGLTRDLDDETTAALREQGGLMARIKDFLATANGNEPAANADNGAGTAGLARPPVLHWQHHDLAGSWGWAPCTIDSLQHQ
ncbi:CocE/NonD family hydrolase [Arthrobacter sp. R3-55]